MGAETEQEPGHNTKDNTHIVQATDSLGRTVSRDAFKSRAEADVHAAKLKQEGHTVDVSPLEPQPKP